MQDATKEAFDAFLASRSTRSEPDDERDGQYYYENWLDMDGNEIATAIYHNGQAVGWMIADE